MARLTLKASPLSLEDIDFNKELRERQLEFIRAIEEHYERAPAMTFSSEESFKAGFGNPRIRRVENKPRIAGAVWTGSYRTETAGLKSKIKGSKALYKKLYVSMSSSATDESVWEGKQGDVTRYGPEDFFNLKTSIERKSGFKEE